MLMETKEETHVGVNVKRNSSRSVDKSLASLVSSFSQACVQNSVQVGGGELYTSSGRHPLDRHSLEGRHSPFGLTPL